MVAAMGTVLASGMIMVAGGQAMAATKSVTVMPVAQHGTQATTVKPNSAIAANLAGNKGWPDELTIDFAQQEAVSFTKNTTFSLEEEDA
ncbi:hypothetical protein [Streptacidiphilus sp. EB129]|uniref:hypothetical protein n=1 Tax=Streptacidiphilus sp. EB129 TaxID=3156262 RepID=UPI003518C1A4